MMQIQTTGRAVVDRFGGIHEMARKLGHKNHTTVQGWADRGVIPARRHQEIMRAAREHGIQMLPADLITSGQSIGTEIADRISSLRKAVGLSQAALAEAIGTTLPMMGKLERGERLLTLKWIEKIAQALGCDPSSLMEVAGRPATKVSEENTISVHDTLDLSRLRPADRLALMTIYNSLVSV